MASSTMFDISSIYDQLQVMRRQEETTYRSYNYITQIQETQIDANCRLKMSEWCFQVADFCNFQRETVLVAMSCLDRYVCTPQGQDALFDSTQYQLAAMTAFYLSVKAQETSVVTIDVMVKLSRDLYCREKFEAMERKILNALQWRINGPTPYSFIRNFVALMRGTDFCIDSTVSNAIMEDAFFQAELAVTDSRSLDLLPSQIALVAINTALSRLQSRFVSSDMQEYFRVIEKVSGLSIKDVLHSHKMLDYTSCEENAMKESNSNSHPTSPVSVTRKGISI